MGTVVDAPWPNSSSAPLRRRRHLEEDRELDASWPEDLLRASSRLDKRYRDTLCSTRRRASGSRNDALVWKRLNRQSALSHTRGASVRAGTSAILPSGSGWDARRRSGH